MNTKTPITLTSPSPLDDGGRKYNIIYIIFAIIGVMFCLFSGNASSFILGLFIGLLCGWVIKMMILSYKGSNLRNLKFQLEYPISMQDLIPELITTLTPLHMTVEINTDGSPVITYKGKIYDVIFNDDQTFQLWWRKSFLSALVGLEGEIRRYRKLVVGMGIIAYHIQDIARKEKAELQTKTNNFDTSNNKPETAASTSHPSTQTHTMEDTRFIFCTNCGTKLKNTESFCINCGHRL